MTRKSKKVDPDIVIFQLQIIEPSDPSVGIQGIYAPATLVLPKYFIPEDQEVDFEKELALFLKSWTDGGRVLTSAEKAAEDASQEEINMYENQDSVAARDR